MSEPMSDERLTEIRERAFEHSDLAGVFRGQSKELRTAERDRRALVAEVDRLRARVAELERSKSNVECNFVQYVLDSQLEKGQLAASVAELEGRAQRARALHGDDGSGNCLSCAEWQNGMGGEDMPYPCPTARALDGSEPRP